MKVDVALTIIKTLAVQIIWPCKSSVIKGRLGAIIRSFNCGTGTPQRILRGSFEIQADKDSLRAEYAMSTRRLEMSVEQLKARATSQLADIDP